MRRKLKAAVSVVGFILGLAGLVFLAMQLAQYVRAPEVLNLSLTVYLVAAGCAALYVMGNLALTIAYHKFLRQSARAFSYTAILYGISQIAKYVPGNILHLAGRQAVGAQLHFEQSSLAKATFIEIISLALSATLFGSVLILITFLKTPPTLAFAFWVILQLFALLILARIFGKKIATGFALHTAYFLLSGFGFAILFAAISYSTRLSVDHILLLAAAFVVAWVAGFLTPGSPAGLGVREAALIFMLGPQFEGSEIVLAVLMSRISNIFGDVIFFFAAFGSLFQLMKHLKRPAFPTGSANKENPIDR
ncbi:putative membrane protein [Hyphomonas neptunium ATCC 15444]|uniref:Putative membrane protein n=1 Tax=Hyphomonas neptunium (strain ATCC 15444) TaxID=228405 RepID=Q0C416_HYPNA|nr:MULTISPECIES: hypothetical protein [Hyphomonas]ABI78083.1 putative membrane protein [Hyphomonas neptunium ATCC 15444]